MPDIPYSQLKSLLIETIKPYGEDANAFNIAFSKLYSDFQTDAIHNVTIESIPGTKFNWVKSQTSNKDKVIIFFHGGGYVAGSTKNHLELIAQLISRTNVTVLSVDYRTDPLSFFPASLEDAKAAYTWLLSNGHHSQQVGLAGISAGAMLVTQLIVHCHLESLPQPKVALVLSGPRNLYINSPSTFYNISRDWMPSEFFQTIQNYYLPKDGETKSPLYSPIDFDYTKFPITLFQAGDYELLVDDSMLFYERLRITKFNVYLDIVTELPHCWQLFAKSYAPGRAALQNAINFITHFF